METDGIMAYLITQGALGVACIVLAFVCVKLYNKTERLEKEKSELQEARRLETKETTKEVISVLSANANSMQVLSEKIEIAKQRGQ